ncbi:TetR/AcrR family transcriptional regulator [Kiloniella sp.]|uniref:TetR/AcrR family transcriptional regulator n=1 Tax=Kiloniella sp. TaxID=1938587 RepID=UPI003B01841E
MGRNKTYDRDDVLERAMELFWRVGFEGAHLSSLVEVTGLNRFSLYKEFGGKEGLFEEALLRYLSGARDSYRDLLGKQPSGMQNIKSYFHALNYSPDYHGCFIINTLSEKHVVSDRAFTLVKKFTEEAKVLFKTNLDAAVEVGELTKKTNTKAMSEYLLTVDQGLSIYGIGDPDNMVKDQIIEIALGQLSAEKS